jgi:hypothetical protein
MNMSPERLHTDPKKQTALSELKGMIQAKYPSASFAVRPGIEDPDETWLTTRVDVEDPDEVMDLVIDRLLEIQLDEGIPVHVLPLRTPERVAALRRELAQRHTASSLPGLQPISR